MSIRQILRANTWAAVERLALASASAREDAVGTLSLASWGWVYCSAGTSRDVSNAKGPRLAALKQSLRRRRQQLPRSAPRGPGGSAAPLRVTHLRPSHHVGSCLDQRPLPEAEPGDAIRRAGALRTARPPGLRWTSAQVQQGGLRQRPGVVGPIRRQQHDLGHPQVFSGELSHLSETLPHL